MSPEPRTREHDARDRTVHGRAPRGLGPPNELVRYDRSGKWYLEWVDGERLHLRLAQVVGMAAHPDGEAYLGLPGGRAFDAAVRRRKAER